MYALQQGTYIIRNYLVGNNPIRVAVRQKVELAVVSNEHDNRWCTKQARNKLITRSCETGLVM